MISELMDAVESLGRALGVPFVTDIDHAPCTLGVGCDEAGICYAVAHGQPEQCPRRSIADRFEAFRPPSLQHRPRREGDEWACACGARWGVGETAPAGHGQ